MVLCLEMEVVEAHELAKVEPVANLLVVHQRQISSDCLNSVGWVKEVALISVD